MTGRLSDLEARIDTVHQLGAVIGAMRSIAAARTQEALSRLKGIRAYTRIIASAIGEALAFLPEADHAGGASSGSHGHIVIALCAEQGFAGQFSETVLDRATEVLEAASGESDLIMLIGDRGAMVARERDIAVDWFAPMIGHAAQVALLANRIADALYDRLAEGRHEHVSLVHASPSEAMPFVIEVKRLVPFDFGRFPAAKTAVPPLLTLSPQRLLDRLVTEYVFAELCEAIMQSYAAESEKRMRAMVEAHSNVAEKLDELTALSRRLRQEEITSEILELSAGAAATGVGLD